MENNIQLGGNIELSGFSELSGGDMVIIKKIVGNYVKKISEITSKFKSIKITLKTVHEIEDSKKFEFHVMLITDKNNVAELTERNLYVGLDLILKKVMNIISH